MSVVVRGGVTSSDSDAVPDGRSLLILSVSVCDTSPVMATVGVSVGGGVVVLVMVTVSVMERVSFDGVRSADLVGPVLVGVCEGVHENLLTLVCGDTDVERVARGEVDCDGVAVGGGVNRCELVNVGVTRLALTDSVLVAVVLLVGIFDVKVSTSVADPNVAVEVSVVSLLNVFVRKRTDEDMLCPAVIDHERVGVAAGDLDTLRSAVRLTNDFVLDVEGEVLRLLALRVAVRDALQRDTQAVRVAVPELLPTTLMLLVVALMLRLGVILLLLLAVRTVTTALLLLDSVGRVLEEDSVLRLLLGFVLL